MDFTYNDKRTLLKKGVKLNIYVQCDKAVDKNGERFEFKQENFGKSYKRTWEKILELEIIGRKRKMSENKLNIPINVKWVSNGFEERNPGISQYIGDYLNWKEDDTKNIEVYANRYSSSSIMYMSLKDLGYEFEVTKTYESSHF